jgi:hypothetical protein
MPIRRRHLEANAAFDPEAIKAMSEALERACAALHVNFATEKSSQHASSTWHTMASLTPRC